MVQAGRFLIFRTDQRKAVKTSRTLAFMLLVDIYSADDSKNAVFDKESAKSCLFAEKSLEISKKHKFDSDFGLLS